MYTGVFNGRVYYSKTQGIVAEYDFSCGACQISKLTGYATIRDYDDYEYKTMNATTSGNGYSAVYWSQYSGIKSYSGTTNNFVDFDMHAGLLNGGILGGNNIDLTVDPVTIP